MKKMSEVFELPINHEFLEVYGPERAGVPYTEAEKHAAHAINHVDALAEALEGCAELLLKISFESSDEYQSAMAVLAAYRGKA